MSNKKSMWHNGEGLLFTGKCSDIKINDVRIFNHYRLMATNRFKWHNLPKGLKSEYIEENLFNHGQVLFFDDEELGYLTLPCAVNGGLNVYGEPIDFQVWGIDFSKKVEGEKGVRIKANDTCFPQVMQVLHYSELITQIEDIMKQNLDQQRFPYIISTTKKNELSMKNFFNKVFEGVRAMFIDERLSEGMAEGIKVLKTDAPYLLDDLQIHKEKTVNELLTILGINNLSVNKKERLVTGEVEVNNQNIDMNLDLEFKNRQLACDEINKKFGFNPPIYVEKTVVEIDISQGEYPKGSE